MKDLSVFTKISVTQHIRYIEEQLNTLQKTVKSVNELHDKFCTNEFYTCGTDKENPLHGNSNVQEDALQNTKEDVQEDPQQEATENLANHSVNVHQGEEDGEDGEDGDDGDDGEDEEEEYLTQKKRVGRPPSKQTGTTSKKRKTKK